MMREWNIRVLGEYSCCEYAAFRLPPTPISNAYGLICVSGQRMYSIPTGCRISESFRLVYIARELPGADRQIRSRQLLPFILCIPVCCAQQIQYRILLQLTRS